MKNDNNINNWNSFSRGLCVALLILAIFCGICAIGAAFSGIPWLLLSGGICILLIIGAIVWFLGYLSGKVRNHEDDEDSDIESETESYDSVSQVFRKSDRPVTFVEDKPNDTSTPNSPVSGSKNPPKSEDVKPATQTQKQTQPKPASQTKKQTQSKPAAQSQDQQTQQQQGKQENGNAKQAAQPQEQAAPKKPVADSKQTPRRDISHFDMFPEDSKK